VTDYRKVFIVDDIIETYIDNCYSEEFQVELFRAIHLFDFFQHNTIFTDLKTLIAEESNYSSDDLRDLFNLKIHEGLDYIVEQHMLTLVGNVTLYDKNELLTALGRIQALEDYTSIGRTLENMASDEEQLSSILSELCMLDDTYIIGLIDSIGSTFMQRLREFVNMKEGELSDSFPEERAILKNMKLYVELFGESSVGAILVRDGMLIGDRYEVYLPLIEEDLLHEDDNLTAKNILSTIFMSSDGFNSPLMVYRKYSYRIIKDLNRVSKIEALIGSMLAQLTEAKGLEREQAQLS
jgi:hypothetical protein